AGLAPRNHLMRCTRGLVVAHDLPTTRPADGGTAGRAGAWACGPVSRVCTGAAPPLRSGPEGPSPPSSLRLLTAPLPWALAWCPTVLADDGSPDGRVLRHPLRHQRLAARLGPGLWLVSDAWDAGVRGEVLWHLAGSPRCQGPAASLDLGAAGRLTVLALDPRPCAAEPAGGDRAAGGPALATATVRYRPAGARALTVLALGAEPRWDDGVLAQGDGRWRLSWDAGEVVVDGHRLPRTAPGPA
ncbi:MAG: hypothetical protein L6R48_25295, partial [Planctomycetes bacterium]|nr:hypothetical protein [Planctomycetota bacterium]